MPVTEIGSFKVSRVQVLDEQGRLDAELDPGLGDDRLVELYRAMVLAREADQRMLKLQRQGRIGTFPPCTGQEAVACGVALAMRPSDWMVTAFRELGAMLMRGVPLEKYMALYAGYEEGNHLPEAPRTLPVSVPVGSQIPHATGLAYAMRARGEADTAVVAFFGDGATSEGDFHEALNLAGVWKVPVVFVCQNNGWAISLPTREQTASRTIAQKAVAYGFEGVQVDGNDALGVYKVTAEALDKARAGGGPTLIEAVTYRLMMHTTSDDPTKYRTEQEVEAWWKKEPIPRLRAHLEQKGIWDEAAEVRLAEETKEEVDRAVAKLESMGEVAPDRPFDHVHESPHPTLQEQREELLAALALEAPTDG